MNETPYRFPMSRSKGLITNELGDEVLVYDLASHTIHQLNEASAAVWKRCDGRTSLDAVSLSTGLTPDIVRAALTRLDEAGLLEEPLSPELRASTQSRRSFMRKAGAVGTIPIVTSVSAPMAARANSLAGEQCGLPDNFCVTGQSCCGSTLCCDDGTQECRTNPSPFCRGRCGTSRFRCGASPTSAGWCCGNDEVCRDGVCSGRPGGSN